MEYNDENLLTLLAQGLSQSKIAAKLNVTKNTVSGRLSRIRAKSKETIVKPVITKPPKPKKEKPVSYIKSGWTFQSKPRMQMSKADMQSMLKQAVENTK